MKTFLIVCSLVVTVCYAAHRPVIPESFNALTRFEVHRDGKAAEFGLGYWLSDSTGKRQVRNETFDNRKEGYFYQLELFSEHKEYHIRPNDNGKEECNNEPLRGEFVPPFEWLAKAKYNGSETIEHHTLDVWFTRVGTSEFIVGVDADVPNVPVIYREKHQQGEMFLTFTRFTPGPPTPSFFDVPRECQD